MPDQFGFGRSTKPKSFQYSFQQLALNTKALLDTLGINKITVLGHSMAGMAAVRFALMYPKTTEKLVLYCARGKAVNLQFLKKHTIYYKNVKHFSFVNFMVKYFCEAKEKQLTTKNSKSIKNYF